MGEHAPKPSREQMLRQARAEFYRFFPRYCTCPPDGKGIRGEKKRRCPTHGKEAKGDLTTA